MDKDESLEKAAWSRVTRELDRRNVKNQVSWLAKKLECSIQRVQNWTIRGLPPAVFPEVAHAIDESTDYLFGVAEPRDKGLKEPDARAKLTPGGVAAGAAYDRLTPAQQELFLRLVETTYGAPVRERPKELHADAMDIELEDQRNDRGEGGGTGPSGPGVR